MTIRPANTVFVLAAFLYCFAGPASAQVRITEIMYDASGSDSGREWIEITNLGDEAIDLSGFKFFENNTNHGLVLKSGTGVLLPLSSAIIADDETKFKTDWPSFSGTLFSSSFSLSNTGEQIALKNGSLVVFDTVTYDPAAVPAEDGKSLQLSGDGEGFSSETPTPGSYVRGGTAPAPDTSDSESSPPPAVVESSVAPKQESAGVPAISAHIKGQSTVTVGAGSFFEGSSFGTQGQPLRNARYLWNFGDGGVGEGQNVFHTYTYPGSYVVMLAAGHEYSSGAARMTVEVLPAAVSMREEGDGSVTVINGSKRELDIGFWGISDGASTFVIPKGTIVLAGGGVRFSPAILKLQAGAALRLLYPNGEPATSATPSPQHSGITYLSAPAARPRASAASGAAAQREAPPAPSAAVSNDTLAAAAAAAPADGAFAASIAGLLALILIGVAGVRYARLMPAATSDAPPSADAEALDTKRAADEYEIVDVSAAEKPPH